MAVTRYSPEIDPFGALLALQRELGRVFESPRGIDFGPSGRGVYPATNVFSDRDGYVLKMEVPGVSSEALHLETQGRTLTVSGRREPRQPEKGSFHRRERNFGEFSRSFQLPADLDLGRAEASLKHGMLTIRIPKREEAKPRQITVQAA
jgi:HSP20 family protein